MLPTRNDIDQDIAIDIADVDPVCAIATSVDKPQLLTNIGA